MLPAEVEHLLRLGEAADERAGEVPAGQEQVEDVHGLRVARRSDQDQRRVAPQESHQRVQVVVGGDGVEDHVEAGGVLRHRVRVLRDDDLVGAQPLAVADLALRRGEEDRVRAEGVGELHAHVPQPAEPDHAHLLPLARSPLAEGRVRRDPGAEERRRLGGVEVRRDLEREGLVADVLLGVTAEGHAPRVLVGPVVGEHELVGAELLESVLAARAGPARVHETPDSREVAHLEAGDILPDARDPADDLVPGHDRVAREAPLVPGEVQVAVAHPAVEDVHLDVARQRLASREGERGEGRRGRLCGECSRAQWTLLGLSWGTSRDANPLRSRPQLPGPEPRGASARPRSDRPWAEERGRWRPAGRAAR